MPRHNSYPSNRDKEIRSVIGDFIKSTRICHGLSQAEIGNNVGISAEMVSRYEAGKNAMNFEMFQRFSEALHLPFCDALKIIQDDLRR